MTGGFKILITSGLSGVLISTIVNMFISIKILRAQKNLEAYKVSLAFLKEKLDLLKNLRISITRLTDLKPFYEAIRDENSNKKAKLLGERMREYLNRVNSYKEIRYCFSDNLRQKLDELINQIDPVYAKLIDYNLDNLARHKDKHKVPNDIHISLRLLDKLISEFNESLVNAIDKELESIAEKLSNFA